MTPKINLCWLRRDLRLNDQAALYHALKDKNPVVPVFVFDTNILDDLEDKHDRRVTFIHEVLEDIQRQLVAKGTTLDVFYGTPEDAFRHWTSRYPVEKVFTTGDYEPYARKRDADVAAWLHKKKISFHSYKDQVIFEKSEVVKDNGDPYTIFTPYSKRWLATLKPFYLKPYPVEKYESNWYQQRALKIPSLAMMGFKAGKKDFPSKEFPESIITHYDQTRDFPALAGTTGLGVHLRFGTVSIRELMQRAMQLNQTFAKELIWRDFFQMILWHFPHAAGASFRKEYDNIRWRNNEAEFERWCTGQTGYPIVDAGMRELNATGHMHNRVRMITASFLTKHLLIDWRWGEAYFAAKLLDYDLASNNGNWQWAAGCGCDAAPYFRVFNPALQTKKFDKDLRYIRRWVPEFEDLSYVHPVVSHEEARKRAIAVYSQAVKR
ncbi:cryptochrome/photolyase family protein [Chitinophaga flava]|uniref:Deoxyribodipyrimidine photolyase n=1 Tax=Chitinophaga flava TaxID=2259036 RepID=A0A365Y2C0_9BACT|nr:deoxyribodipyrimidine photo-lyase [Chitinophaga flava]RBL92640.1 deoxyribodipyrimidine photolyase [Chitinophaga flava]